MKLRLMLDGQRRQVRVRREVASRAKRFQEPEEDFRVPLSWMHDAHVGPRKPGAGMGAGRRHWQRAGEDVTVGDNAYEAQERDPGKANRPSVAHQVLPPCARGSMERRL